MSALIMIDGVTIVILDLSRIQTDIMPFVYLILKNRTSVVSALSEMTTMDMSRSTSYPHHLNH